MCNDSSVDRAVATIETLAARLGPGVRLPSTRKLAADLQAGPVTIQKALERLVNAAVVETRPGVGTFVSAKHVPDRVDTRWQETALSPHPLTAGPLRQMLESAVAGVLQMGAGHLDESLRADALLGQSTARAARRPGIWGNVPTRGLPELRGWFAAQLSVDPEDVLITAAGQASLSAALRALTRWGDTVLVATPAYPGLIAAARTAGLQLVGIPTDADGVRVDLLEAALDRHEARLLYLQPAFANPDGSVLAPKRRTELLELAGRRDLFLLEDDWARWLGHGEPVPPSLQGLDRDGHVITVCSLSKVCAPGLRLGAVAARGAAAARIADARIVDDLFVSGPLQAAAVDMVSSPSWRAHLRKVSTALRNRCESLACALTDALPVGASFVRPSGGLSLWLELPPGVNDHDVAREAAARRLYVLPGSHYEIAPSARSHLRLSFSALPEHDARLATERLAAALAECAA